jgi:hypothetical protein|tara:strand:+ start:23 stop:1039 length:1017 start_codon:yes stop_codon:yes gene_type:complete
VRGGSFFYRASLYNKKTIKNKKLVKAPEKQEKLEKPKRKDGLIVYIIAFFISLVVFCVALVYHKLVYSIIGAVLISISTVLILARKKEGEREKRRELKLKKRLEKDVSELRTLINKANKFIAEKNISKVTDSYLKLRWLYGKLISKPLEFKEKRNLYSKLKEICLWIRSEKQEKAAKLHKEKQEKAAKPKKINKPEVYYTMFFISMLIVVFTFVYRHLITFILGISLMLLSLLGYRLNKRKMPKKEETKKERLIEIKGMEIKREKYETDFDVLYKLVKRRGSIKLSEIEKYFGIDKKLAEEWCMILEGHSMLKLHYPPFGEPELKVEKEANERNKRKV